MTGEKSKRKPGVSVSMATKLTLLATSVATVAVSVVALVSYFWFESIGIALVIGVALLINLIVAVVAGVLIPFTLNRMGYDPALSGAVVLTTVTDIVGFLTFLGLATLFLL